MHLEGTFNCLNSASPVSIYYLCTCLNLICLILLVLWWSGGVQVLKFFVANCLVTIYLSEPQRHDGSGKPLESGAPLCNWCGTWKGDKICGSCIEARYCSEKYQAMHWRAQVCQNSSRNAGNSSAEHHKSASRSLWPEHKIVNEDEAKYDVNVSADQLSGIQKPDG